MEKIERKESKNQDKDEKILEGMQEIISDIVPKDIEAPKEKTPKNNIKLYFNSDTQDAIVKYQGDLLKKEKDKLYVTEILPAFKKLAENLINIHKFSGIHDTHDELKNDCVNFLFETIRKFDSTRGTNAFSYFNVVAKNWLIIRTKQKSQRNKKSVSLDDPEALTTHESLIIEAHNTLQAKDVSDEFSVSLEGTVSLLYEIRSKVKTENELTCINSIITIFENIDEIDLLNKSAVLLYMRELSGLSPKQLTTAMQSIKRRYKKSKFDSRDA